FRVDFYVAIPIVRFRPIETYSLMPAVHAAHRIRLNREREVLMHPHLAPPDPLGVRVAAAERTRAVNLPHAITPLLARDCHERRGRPRAAGLFVQTPAAEMMRHAKYAGTDAFGHPRARHEPADPRPHLDQISRADALFLRVDRRN